MPITISDKAARELATLLGKEGKTGAMLRVWVAGMGCSGLRYGMGIEDKTPEAGDQIFESNGMKVVMDADSIRFMDNSRIDFVDDPESGGFSVDNPNPLPPSSCSCGGSCGTSRTGETETPAQA